MGTGVNICPAVAMAVGCGIEVSVGEKIAVDVGEGGVTVLVDG